MKNIYKQYAEIREQISKLEMEEGVLHDKIQEDMIQKGLDKVEELYGKFKIAVKPKWTYSNKVDELKDRLDKRKIEEQERGIATAVETKYLVYKSNEEKN